LPSSVIHRKCFVLLDIGHAVKWKMKWTRGLEGGLVVGGRFGGGWARLAANPRLPTSELIRAVLFRFRYIL